MYDKDQLDMLRHAVGAHGAWKLKLSAAARSGKVNFQVDELARADRCEFGRWLDVVAPELGKDPTHARIKRMHADFHRNAGKVAAMIKDGQTDAALEEISHGAFARESTALADAVTDWRLDLRRRG